MSFFGGGTDYKPWYLENGGAVLATTIDKYCYISCRRLPQFFDHTHRIVYSKIENVKSISEIEHPSVRHVFDWIGVDEGLEIHHDGDLPARSGLGSSSSFTVGLIHAVKALNGSYCSKSFLADSALHVEQDLIKENVGSQDQISAAFGGFNKIDFHRSGDYSVSPLIAPRENVLALERHMMLFFTGLTRFASEVAKDKISNLASRQDELVTMHQMVDEGVSIMSAKNFQATDFGNLLDEGWRLKKSLSQKISNSAIDDMYSAAKAAGAVGGKLLGAGAGGFLLLLVEPERQINVRKALAHLTHVPFKFENQGSAVVLYQPEGL